MPSASERIATIVNPGFFPNIRNPYRASSTKSSSHRHPHAPLVASFTNSIFPNSRRAARSASFAASPRSSRSRAAISRWLLNSSSSSASRLLRRQKLTGHLCISLLPYFLTSLLPYFLTSLFPCVPITLPAAAPPRSHRKAATISNVPCSVVSFQRPSAGKTLPVACFRRFAIPPQSISVFRVGAAPDKENPYPPAATRRNGSESPR